MRQLHETYGTQLHIEGVERDVISILSTNNIGKRCVHPSDG